MDSHIKEPTADITVNAASSAISITVGSHVTFTLSISNTNIDRQATDVVLQYALPPGFQVDRVDPTWSCGIAFGILTCGIGTLGPGRANTVSVVGVATTPGTVQSAVWVTSRNDDPALMNNSATILLNALPALTPTATLAFTQTASSPTVIEGDNFNYDLFIANTSNTAAISVTLYDILPQGLAVASVTPPTQCENDGHVLYCSLGNIEPGFSKTIAVTAHAVQNGIANNTAFITFANPASSQSATTTVVRVAPKMISAETASLAKKVATVLASILVVLAVLIVALARLFYRQVPVDYAGLIKRDGRWVGVGGTGALLVWPFIERFELRDNRPKTHVYSATGVTGDNVRVTFRICIDIQVEPANLLPLLQHNIKPEHVVERAIDEHIARDTGRFTFDQIQSDLRSFRIHLEKSVCRQLDGVQNNGIKAFNPRILSYQPDELVKAAAEELKRAKIEEEAAHIRDRIAAAQKLSDAEARAARLKVLDEAIDRAGPRAIEYDVTISGAGRKSDEKDAGKKS